MVYGYHRTSTREQHLDRGIREITDFCSGSGLPLERIYTDQHTGKNFDRPRYTVLRDDVLREGDILIITEVDRLGRNKKDILEQLNIMKLKKIRIMILEVPTTLQDIGTYDSSMASMIMETINNLLIEIYATLAQAETDKKEKRQREGIEAMKARGEWYKYGRPSIMDKKKFAEEYRRVQAGEVRPYELIKELGISKATFYRYSNELNKETDQKNGVRP